MKTIKKLILALLVLVVWYLGMVIAYSISLDVSPSTIHSAVVCEIDMHLTSDLDIREVAKFCSV
jgi:hypothetical protein